LRLQGETVDVVTTESFKRGDQIGTNTLRGEMRMQVGLRVQHPRTAIAAHGNPRHGLHAANHDQILKTGPDLHCPQVHGFQARGAEAVDLHARHVDSPVGHQGSRLGDVGALVADRCHAAQHDVVNLTGVQLIARLQGRQQSRHQIYRFDAVQRSIGLALASGVRNASKINASLIMFLAALLEYFRYR
jgi:hypothetical protein